MQPAQMNLVRITPVYIHDEERVVNITRIAHLRRHRQRDPGDRDLPAVPRERVIVGGHHFLADMDLLRLPGVGATHRNAIQVSAHVGDDVIPVGGPVGGVPLSVDGKESLRGLLLDVINQEVCAVFRRRGRSGGLGCVLRGKCADSKKRSQA